MNWKKEAENELRDYPKLQNTVLHNTEIITDIDRSITSLRSARIDGVPVSSGANTREDWLVENISKKAELELSSEIAGKQIELIERGLRSLSDDEGKILRLFYIDRPKNYIDRLCDELGYEQSSLYYHKDIALRKYTLAVYGMVDT